MAKAAHCTGSRACCRLQPPAVDALLAPRLDLAEQWVTLVPAAAAGMAQSLAQPWQLLQPFLVSVLQPAAACLGKRALPV